MTRILPLSKRAMVLGRVVGLAREPEPERVDRRAEVEHRQSGALAHARMAAVSRDHQVGGDLERTLRRGGPRSDDRSPSSIRSVTSACISSENPG